MDNDDYQTRRAVGIGQLRTAVLTSAAHSYDVLTGQPVYEAECYVRLSVRRGTLGGICISAANAAVGFARPYDGGLMTQEKARVHELAKELGVTSREILVACANYGEFIKSASSTLEAPLARRLRADLGGRTNSISARDYGVSADSRPTVADDGGFSAAYTRAQRLSSSTSSGSHKPGAIESAIYRYVIDPHRARRGGYTPEERDRAQRLTKQWATTWLSDIVDWIRVSCGQHPDIAVKLSGAGLTPADSELRLGFGRIDPTRATIIERVAKGTLGIKDAVRQVQEFRGTQQSTGS